MRVGDVPRKRHIWHEGGDGRRLAEELMGEEGFNGASSLLYHLHSPSAITGVEPLAAAPLARSPPTTPSCPGTCRRHQMPARRGPGHRPPGPARQPRRHHLLGRRRPQQRAVPQRRRRRARLPAGRLGHPSVRLRRPRGRRPATTWSIPASTTHRWVVPDEADARVRALVLEAAGHVSIPSRYLTATGQLREGAPFSERDLRPPREPLVVDQDGPAAVLVRTGQGWSRHCHAHHPFDVVGWDGCAYPFALSIRDFEPIVGRIHQPPPVHQTFAGPGFVVCSFVPRPYDFDPRSVKVPYHHANVDSDEVLFYAGGDFMSRRGTAIQQGR